MTVENILTIDLEDWFHICGLEEMIPETSWSNLESRVSVNTSKILNIFDVLTLTLLSRLALIHRKY